MLSKITPLIGKMMKNMLRLAVQTIIRLKTTCQFLTRIARSILAFCFDILGDYLVETSDSDDDIAWALERFPKHCPKALSDTCKQNGKAMLLFWGFGAEEKSATGFYPLLPPRPMRDDIFYLPNDITALVALQWGKVVWGYSIRCDSHREALMMTMADGALPVVFHYDEDEDKLSYCIYKMVKQESNNGTGS